MLVPAPFSFADISVGTTALVLLFMPAPDWRWVLVDVILCIRSDLCLFRCIRSNLCLFRMIIIVSRIGTLAVIENFQMKHLWSHHAERAKR